MGLFDFLKGKEQKNKWTKPKEHVVSAPAPKKDLGVCIPDHAKTPEERKKNKKKEVNPFDKLRMEHEKDLGREVKEILEQEPSEPYEFSPELGVEGIGSAEEEKEQKPTTAFKRKLDDLPSGKTGGVVDETNTQDELDVASEKMSQGYVPRFSATARQKLGLEEKQPTISGPTASFEVTGSYLGAETMLSGNVLDGRITKRMSATLGKGSLRITDIKRGGASMSELREGESGTLFVRGSAGTIKNGDVLEFS